MTNSPIQTTRPRRTQWPLRPGLTAALLGAALLVMILVVVFTRQNSTIGWAIAQRIGLGEFPAQRLPDARRAVVWIDKGEPTVVLGPADGPMGPELEAAIAAAAGRPAQLWTIKPLSLVNTGYFAPTRRTAKVEWTTASVPGATDLLPEAVDVVPDAVAHELSAARRAYGPFADAIRANASLRDGQGELDKMSIRGWIANAVLLAALAAAALSLAPRRNRLINTWDEGLGYYDQVGPIALLALLWGSAPAILGIMLLLNIGPISEMLNANPAVGWFGFVAVFIVSAGIGFLPTYGQSILGGWVFGLAAGFPGAMLGFVGGSMIGYGIAQRVSKRKVEELIEKNPKSKAVREALLGHGFWRTVGIVTLIRIPPNSPFALTNLMLASAGVGFLPYVLGTAIGMAPRTLLAVAFAAAGRQTGARDIQEFISEQPWWALPAGFALLAVCVGIIGLIAKRALRHVTDGRVGD